MMPHCVSSGGSSLSVTALVVAGMLGLAGGPIAAGATVITVIGENDALVDRQNIQDAIDIAGEDSTVNLEGTFQLDGERILIGLNRLALVGSAVDNDGDGQTNEDWADGADNDGDGLVDEDDWDTVVNGVAHPDGTPVLNDGVNGLFNRGFVVDGFVDTGSDDDSDGALKNMVIRDIAFSTHHHAISLIPEWYSPTGRCEDRVRVNGSMTHVRIEANKFEGNELGIVIQGAVHHSTVEGNLFLSNRVFGVVFEGGEDDCPLADGGAIDLSLSRPRGNTILRNSAVDSVLGTFMTDTSWVGDNSVVGAVVGVFSTGDRQSHFRDNEVVDCSFGIAVDGGQTIQIKGNRIGGGFIGIDSSDVLGTAMGVSVIDNVIEGAGLFGLAFEFGATGHFATGNQVSGSGFVDVFLDFDTANNKVINQGDAQTAFDLGFNNKLLGDFILF